MRRYRLFCSNLTAGTVLLSSEETRHALLSLRVKPGQEVTLFDGAGREAHGIVSRADASDGHRDRHRPLSVDVGTVICRPFELIHRVTLGVAMTKLPRQGYLIEKCTELGVDAIWPMTTDRSVAKTSDAAVERWRRRAVEAAKQSDRAWVPRILRPNPFAEVLARIGEFDAAGLADVSADTTIESFLAPQDTRKSALVLIGPEGGWSDVEREQAQEAGLTPIRLGPTILRTETAAVAVCAVAALLGRATDSAVGK